MTPGCSRGTSTRNPPLAWCVALTMGLSSEAQLIPRRPWVPGIRSGQLCLGDATFLTCFLKSPNSKDLQNKPGGGRTGWNPAELKPEHHWPGLWGSRMTPAFQQTGRGRPHSPTFWMQRLRLRAGTHVLKPRSPVSQEEGVPVDFGISACGS